MGNASPFEKSKTRYASLLPSHFRMQIKTSESGHGFVWSNQKLIGSGEYSIVYAGRQKVDNVAVAVKKIRSKNITDERKQRILNEIMILKHICTLPKSSKYFVFLMDAFPDQDSNIYIVTKYINGCELYNIVSGKKKTNSLFKECFVRKMLFQIFKAVELLHQNDIAHRDIKLENIMYDKETKDLKLIDFGFAMRTSTKTDNGERKQILSKNFCGSLHYVAPEIALERPHDSKKVDVWALGVLAFALFTNEFPFSHSNNQVVFQQIISGKYQNPTHLSSQGINLLSLLLEVNSSKRPSISDLLAHPWWSCHLERD